jgi:tetratricopeptide (TPR) repeat protein
MLLTGDPRFKRATELMNSAQYLDALHEIDEMLGHLSGADRLAALYWKVNCLTWLGEVKQARSCVDEALTKVSARDPLRICLELESAFLLRTEDRPARAAIEIRSLLDRFAKEMKSEEFFWIYVQAKTYLGSCLSLAGRYSEAAKELEEALSLEIQPLARYYIQFWLGDAYYQLGDFDKAREHLERALGEAQSAPKAGLSAYYAARLPYELALIAYHQRRFADAKRHLEIVDEVGAKDTNLLRVIELLRVAVGKSGQA